MLWQKTGTAQGAITKNRIVKFGSADDTYAVATTPATDRIAGVFIGPSDAADSDTIEVCMLGECNLEVSGAIGRGMSLTTNGSGQGVNAAPVAGTNNKIVAMAQISGTDTTIPVFVVPGWFQG